MRYDEIARQVPAGLVEQDNSVRTRRHFGGDPGEMKVHGFCVAGWQDQSCSFTLFRADGAENVGRRGALVTWRTGARTTFGPPPRDLVLLADTRLVPCSSQGQALEPYLYPVRIDPVLAHDLIQAAGEVFLKSSIAPATWARWRGRADSLR